MKQILLSIIILSMAAILFSSVSQSYMLSNPQISQGDHGLAVKLEGAKSISDPGEPDLPWFGFKILLPIGMEAEDISIKRYGEIRISLDDIVMPVQRQYPLSFTKEIQWDEPKLEIYNSFDAYPVKYTKGLSTHFLSGHPIAFGAVSPFEYYPKENELIFYTGIEVTVNYSASKRAQEAMTMLKKDSFIARRLSQSVDNVHDIPTYQYMQNQGYEYLMIVEESKIPIWESLAEMYEGRGITVLIKNVNQILASQTGQDAQEKIRNYIISAYDSNPLRYVLLGGDVEIIPHRGFYVNMGNQGESDDDIPSDMYYSCLDGNWNYDGDEFWGEAQEADLIPEIAIGRICYNNDQEIINQINKIFMYQVAPVGDHVKTVDLVGEWLWDGPTWGGDYMDELIGGSSIHGYTTVGIPEDWGITTLYDRTNGYSDSWGPYQIRPILSEGANLVNHQGHSATTYNMRLSNNQVTETTITNDGVNGNYSIYFTQGCYAGSFDNRDTDPNSYGTDCITEKFTSIPTSAAGMISHSRYGWGVQGSTNGASQYFHREYIDALFGENIYELGYTLVDSKIDNIPFITGSAVMHWVTYETNLFGCPVTNVWTDTPAELVVQWPDTWLIGLNQYTIQTNAAFAQLKIKRQDEIVHEAFGDENGIIHINLEQDLVPGNYTIYVNAKNHFPCSQEIFVTSADMPYLICEDISVIDNDGILHTGEEMQLSFQIKNLGMIDQEGFGEVTVSSESSNIDILQGSYTFENVNAGADIQVDSAFDIAIVGAFEDQSVATLTFTVNYGDFETQTNHDILLSAPILELVSYTIETEDIYLMPGDVAQISFIVENHGHGTAFSPSIVLFTNDSSIMTSVFDVPLPVIEGESFLEINDAFYVTISEDAEIGSTVCVNYMLVAENGSTGDGSFVAHIGMINYGFEEGEQGWDSQSLNPSFINQWHRSSYMNVTSGGSFSMKFGGQGAAQYASGAYGALISPEMYIAPNSVLKFWHWMDAEIHENQYQAWDGGNVQMSIDGGEWFVIEPSGSYPCTIYDNPDSPFMADTPVYSGSFGWTEASFELGAHTGQARFRFVFGSDGYVTGEGWYIDDLRLESNTVSNADYNAPMLPLTLSQNYPNPFNPSTTISFGLPSQQHVRLSIYNLKGQLVRILVDSELPAGQNTCTWDGKDSHGKSVASGVYSYRLHSESGTLTKRMILMK
nr:hypothetical protein [Candidatus Cloacimonadota bacterium]